MRTWMLVVALTLTAMAFSTMTSCSGSPESYGFPELRGDYLGQTLPGSEPEVFAPGLVSTGLYTRDLTISPPGDEIFFSVAFIGGSAIMVADRDGDRWREPRVAAFSGAWRDFEPFVTANGDRLLFLSNRPPPGLEKKPGWGHQNIWQVSRTSEGWSEPELLPAPINTEGHEFFPSVTADGTLYFTRGSGGLKAMICRSRRTENGYSPPEELPVEVNSGESQYNAWISPDEDLLLFAASGREDSRGGSDCYVSFRRPDDTWVGPINLGDRINDTGSCESASLSPDGTLLFFMSDRRDPIGGHNLGGLTLTELLTRQAAPGNGSADIYWVDAGFIAELRPQ